VKGGYWTCLAHVRDFFDKSNHSAGNIKGIENPQRVAISQEALSAMQMDYQRL
jgi:hypothetical protein